MTVNEILDFARDLTHTTTDTIPNTKAIVWANIIYYDLLDKIVQNNGEDRYVKYIDIDAVVGQSSYDLSTAAADMIKLKSVKIKPKGYSDYIESTEIDFFKQPQDLEWLLSYQSLDSPRHQIINKALYIAPKFTTDTYSGVVDNNQIRIYFEARQSALAVAGAESTINLPVQHHHAIAIGMKQYIYSYLRKTNEKNDSLLEYNVTVQDILADINGLDDTKNYISIPDDELLQ